MISNTLLFTPEITEKAKNEWNLTKLQVTIDGLGEDYDNIKNYDNVNGSAFDILMNNLRYIKDNSEIAVSIRINVTHENIDKVEELIKYLRTELKSSKFSIYMKMIYEIENNLELLKKNNFEEKFNEIYDRNFSMRDKYLIKKCDIMNCMADKCSSVVFMPNGNIFNCEHCNIESLIGEIDKGIYIQENIDRTLNKLGDNVKFCKDVNCKLLPICKRCNFCTPNKRCIKNDLQEHEIEIFIKRLKYTTNYYFNKLSKINE